MKNEDNKSKENTISPLTKMFIDDNQKLTKEFYIITICIAFAIGIQILKSLFKK